MKTTIQRANERGQTLTSWLDSKHCFSFGDYQNPEKIGFGLLRVLNDDELTAGKGFNNQQNCS